METQNDPFQAGGSITSSSEFPRTRSLPGPLSERGACPTTELTLGMIVTHLITGYGWCVAPISALVPLRTANRTRPHSMDFLSSFSWDWSLLKGKMGCKPGAFILYFGCRYLGMLSVVATIVFLDAFPMVFLNVSRPPLPRLCARVLTPCSLCGIRPR